MAPVEAGAVNGLVGVSGDEEAARRLAQVQQQAQQGGVEVLRLVHYRRVITLAIDIVGNKLHGSHTRLLPRFSVGIFEPLRVRLVDAPDGLFLYLPQSHFAPRTARYRIVVERGDLARHENFVYLFLHITRTQPFNRLPLRLPLQGVPPEWRVPDRAV